jgi:hypothetical protein
LGVHRLAADRRPHRHRPRRALKVPDTYDTKNQNSS